MEKYVSKQVVINKPDHLVFSALSDFNNLTPVLKDRVEDWCVEGDVCSFKVKGFGAKMRIVEREEHKLIKITGDDGSPIEFYFWIQIKGVAQDDTRLRLTVHVKLNMMLKMMLGKKLETGIDTMAERIAEAFNRL